jgi:hypothetical protein
MILYYFNYKYILSNESMFYSEGSASSTVPSEDENDGNIWTVLTDKPSIMMSEL